MNHDNAAEIVARILPAPTLETTNWLGNLADEAADGARAVLFELGATDGEVDLERARAAAERLEARFARVLEEIARVRERL